MSDLTIIIPCKDDPALVHCVRSIDDGSPSVVVFNGSSKSFIAKMRRQLENEPVKFEQLSEANLSLALQHGIDCSATGRVLLMDSDCRFRAGSIGAMKRSMAGSAPEASVHKGSVVFGEGGGTISRAISRSRRQHTASRLSAYKPPLAFSKCLAPHIGGYFFDRRLRWKEDADLDRRVREAGVDIVGVTGCVIDHRALTLAVDLRSNYRYGIGAALAEHLEIKLPPPARSLRETWLNEGWGAAVYMALANRVRSIGLVSTRLKLALGLERVASRPR